MNKNALKLPPGWIEAASQSIFNQLQQLGRRGGAQVARSLRSATRGGRLEQVGRGAADLALRAGRSPYFPAAAVGSGGLGLLGGGAALDRLIGARQQYKESSEGIPVMKFSSMVDVSRRMTKESQGGWMGRLADLARSAGGGIRPHLPALAAGGAGGALAGLGASALASALTPPDMPPPPVVRMAQFLQVVRPELDWDDAVEAAYEGWERHQETKEGSDHSDPYSIHKVGADFISLLSDQDLIYSQHDRAKLAFIAGFTGRIDKEVRGKK